MISRIINKYRCLSEPVKASLWFTICTFIQRGISLLTTPIFARLLSTEQYGVYSTYVSWENIFVLIVTLSLHKSLMNLFVKYDNYKDVLASVTALQLLLSFFWMILGIVFCNPLSGILRISPILVCCLFTYCFFQAIFQCWTLYKRYIYDYKISIIITVLLALGSSLLGVTFVALVSPTADARAASVVITYFVVGIFLCFDIFRKSKVFYWHDVWLFAIGFCLPLLPHYLSEFVLQSSDKIMINYMCGSEDVAIYSVAYSVGSLITIFTTAINSSFAPYQYQKTKSGEYKLLSKRANQVLVLIGFILVGIMMFSKEIVLVFGGYKYINSVSVIIPICLGAYFNYMFQLFARVQEYYERKLTVVIPSILCAILNLILNYIFIQIYGYQAAAYTTFVCYLSFCIIHYLFYKKLCNDILDGQELYDVKTLVLISISIIALGFIIFFVNQILWLKYSLICCSLLLLFIYRHKLIYYIIKVVEK